MHKLQLADIAGMKGNGSSTRGVLKCLLDKGADVYLLQEGPGSPPERFFLVKYDNLQIPLRTYKLNFYSVLNSHLAVKITSNKQTSASVLQAYGVPTPQTLLYEDSAQAESFLAQHSTCVVKPRQGSHGEGITMGVKDVAGLHAAVTTAQEISSEVLIQPQVTGEDFRLLFINYKFVAAVKRLPAFTTGDGKNTVRQLVESSNQKISELWKDILAGKQDADSTRGSISKTPLEEIVASHGEEFLNSVPAVGEQVTLVDKANVSLGGQTVDVTDSVNHELARQLTNMLETLGLPLCGVDVLSSDIGNDPDKGKSMVIELNASPGLRLHELPSQGTPRPVYKMVADALVDYYSNPR